MIHPLPPKPTFTTPLSLSSPVTSISSSAASPAPKPFKPLPEPVIINPTYHNPGIFPLAYSIPLALDGKPWIVHWFRYSQDTPSASSSGHPTPLANSDISEPPPKRAKLDSPGSNTPNPSPLHQPPHQDPNVWLKSASPADDPFHQAKKSVDLAAKVGPLPPVLVHIARASAQDPSDRELWLFKLRPGNPSADSAPLFKGLKAIANGTLSHAAIYPQYTSMSQGSTRTISSTYLQIPAEILEPFSYLRNAMVSHLCDTLVARSAREESATHALRVANTVVYTKSSSESLTQESLAFPLYSSNVDGSKSAQLHFVIGFSNRGISIDANVRMTGLHSFLTSNISDSHRITAQIATRNVILSPNGVHATFKQAVSHQEVIKGKFAVMGSVEVLLASISSLHSSLELERHGWVLCDCQTQQAFEALPGAASITNGGTSQILWPASLVLSMDTSSTTWQPRSFTHYNPHQGWKASPQVIFNAEVTAAKAQAYIENVIATNGAATLKSAASATNTPPPIAIPNPTNFLALPRSHHSSSGKPSPSLPSSPCAPSDIDILDATSALPLPATIETSAQSPQPTPVPQQSSSTHGLPESTYDWGLPSTFDAPMMEPEWSDYGARHSISHNDIDMANFDEAFGLTEEDFSFFDNIPRSMPTQASNTVTDEGGTINAPTPGLSAATSGTTDSSNGAMSSLFAETSPGQSFTTIQEPSPYSPLTFDPSSPVLHINTALSILSPAQYVVGDVNDDFKPIKFKDSQSPQAHSPQVPFKLLTNSLQVPINNSDWSNPNRRRFERLRKRAPGGTNALSGRISSPSRNYRWRSVVQLDDSDSGDDSENGDNDLHEKSRPPFNSQQSNDSVITVRDNTNIVLGSSLLLLQPFIPMPNLGNQPIQLSAAISLKAVTKAKKENAALSFWTQLVENPWFRVMTKPGCTKPSTLNLASISTILVETCSLSLGAISPPGMFEDVTPMNIQLNHHNAVMKMSSASLPFWPRLGFQPLAGEKSVQSLVIVENGTSDLEASALSWLDSVSEIYQEHHLGVHKYASFLDSPIISLASTLEHSDAIITSLCSKITALDAKEPPIVVYILCAGYLDTQRLRGVSQTLLRLEACHQNVIVQYLPTCAVNNPRLRLALFSSWLEPRTLLRSLAMMVYDRIRLPISPLVRSSESPTSVSDERFMFPAYRIADTLPAKSFDLVWPAPTINVNDRHRFLHVAYGVSVDGKWLWLSAIDARGEGHQLSVKRLTDQDCNLQAIVEAVWQFANQLARKAPIEWRLVIVKDKQMILQEIQAWHNLLHKELPKLMQSLHVTIACAIRNEDQMGHAQAVSLSPEDHKAEEGTLVDLEHSYHAHFQGSPSIMDNEYLVHALGLSILHLQTRNFASPSQPFSTPHRATINTYILEMCSTKTSSYSPRTLETHLRDLTKSYADLAELGRLRWKMQPSAMPWHLAVICLIDEYAGIM